MRRAILVSTCGLLAVAAPSAARADADGDATASVDVSASAKPEHDKDEVVDTAKDTAKDDDKDKDKDNDHDKPSKHQLSPGALLFFVGEYESRPGKEATFDMLLEEARAMLDYNSDFIKAQLEVDLAKAKVHDAYARVGSKAIGARIGQFKMPSTPLQMDSRWKLPLARRGIVAEALDDDVQVSGRRVGAQMEVEREGAVELRALVGAFQPTDAEGEFLGRGVVTVPTLAARVEARKDALKLGGFASRRAIEPAEDEAPDHFLAAGIDISVDYRMGDHQLRVWLEAITGSHQLPEIQMRSQFVSLQAMAAFQVALDRKGNNYVEPFALGAIVDPEYGYGEDNIWEVTGGVALGLHKYFRLTFQAQRHLNSHMTPDAVSAKERTTLIVLAGTSL